MLETTKGISYAVETTPIQKFINFLYFDCFGDKNYDGLLKVLCYGEDCTFYTFGNLLDDETLWINFGKYSRLSKEQLEEIKTEIILESIRKYLTKTVQKICIQ